MTSFAFIAGLIPLVVASGPGAVGNHTIGASSLGGMMLGTVFGVLLVPGLYYIFGTLEEGKNLIRDEDHNPLSEQFVEDQSSSKLNKMVKKILVKLTKSKNEDL
jgi:HAE1 family hydrophobic/amphiphilic exporter-1